MLRKFICLFVLISVIVFISKLPSVNYTLDDATEPLAAAADGDTLEADADSLDADGDSPDADADSIDADGDSLDADGDSIGSDGVVSKELLIISDSEPELLIIES
ncbi:uncharacterized protein LOC128856708 [Anastrepha ludens]|uniref:uncharacterized protein LOC128856708 n=1 Tax=Anastrepha ludens TaxID=28586 RepID=UPI0023AEAA07|nr:uncharacterized protein LOC128856708 [Anastrepha ludens]